MNLINDYENAMKLASSNSSASVLSVNSSEPSKTVVLSRPIVAINPQQKGFISSFSSQKGFASSFKKIIMILQKEFTLSSAPSKDSASADAASVSRVLKIIIENAPRRSARLLKDFRNIEQNMVTEAVTSLSLMEECYEVIMIRILLDPL